MNTPYWFSNLAYWSAQVALLVLAAGFLPHLFKIRQPLVLLIYWRALVVISLLLPFAQPWHQTEIFSSVTFAPRIGEFRPMVITRANPAAVHWHIPSASTIAEIIGLVILAGIAARFTILALGLLKLRQFRQASSPVSNHAESTAVLDEMRLRVNTGGEFRISSDVDSPVTFGLSAPVILLPERFPTLDARHQAAIACHELLHVRRRDWAHHLCEEILRAALWFHPAIAWVIARIRLSREQVVDLEVVRLTDARKPYLEALLEFTNRRALAAAIPAPPFLVERQLAERVALMLKEVRMSRARLIASLTAIAACLGVVTTLAVWAFPLKASPRAAQNPPQGGIGQGVPGGVSGSVWSGISGGVTSRNVTGVENGIRIGVPGGVAGGVSGGVIANPPANAVDGAASEGQNTGDKVYRAGENGISMPKCEYCPRPDFAYGAHSGHLSGIVYLRVTVLKTGRAGGIKVVKGVDKVLNEDAVNTVRNKWTFKPALAANGDPVDAIVPVEISFQFYNDPNSVKPDESQNPPPAIAASNPGGVSTPLKLAEGTNLKIFTAPVSDNGESTPYYMGRVKTQTLYAPRPEFPRLARQMKIRGGAVTLEIILDSEGNVISARADKTSNAIFAQAAIDTVRKWKVTGTHDGVPVTFEVPVDIVFTSY